MRVLAATSDIALSHSLGSIARGAGAVCEHTTSGEEVLDLARHYEFDIVLIDSRLVDMDGYEAVRRMRSARVNTPALVLTDTAGPGARVRALTVGADDVVAKPFDRAELAARVQAIVRRSKGWSAPVLRLGPIELNLDSKAVSVAGFPVPLTAKEYAIFELMVLRKGMVLTKDAFLNHLYGGIDEPEMKIIDVFICKLRKKLAMAGAHDVIATVWGRGYTVQDPAQGEYDDADMPVDITIPTRAALTTPLA